MHPGIFLFCGLSAFLGLMYILGTAGFHLRRLGQLEQEVRRLDREQLRLSLELKEAKKRREDDELGMTPRIVGDTGPNERRSAAAEAAEAAVEEVEVEVVRGGQRFAPSTDSASSEAVAAPLEDVVEGGRERAFAFEPVPAPGGEPGPGPEAVAGRDAGARPTTRPGSVAAESEAPPAPSKPDRPGLEALLGGQVFVWVGAVALALAGAFLVKYSWDNQLLSPGQRLVLAAVFGLALVVAAFPLGRLADRVAAGAAAAGVSTLYGVVFGATSVYGFLGSGVGFALMAGVTAGAVGLSLRFGSFVALLGLLGGFLTPALIGGEEGGRGALVAYLVVLQTGLVFLTRQRGWVGLSVLTLLGSIVWSWFTVVEGGSPTERLLAGVLTLTTAAVFVLNAARLQQAARATPRRRAGVLALAFAGVGAAVTLLGTMAFLQNFSPQELALVGLLSAGTCVLAWFDRRYAVLPWLTLGLSIVLAVAAVETVDEAPPSRWYLLCAGYGGLFALAGFAGSWRPHRHRDADTPGDANTLGDADTPADRHGRQRVVGPLDGLRRVPPEARWATLGVLATAGFASLAWVFGSARLLFAGGLAEAWRTGPPADLEALPDPRWAWAAVAVPVAFAWALRARRPVAAGPWAVGGFGLWLGAAGVTLGAAALPLAFAGVGLAAAAMGLGRGRALVGHLGWPVLAAATLAAGGATLPGGGGHGNLLPGWLAVAALAALAWLMTRWRSGAGEVLARPSATTRVGLVEVAAGWVLAMAWWATVAARSPVDPGTRTDPFFIAGSFASAAWLSTGWAVSGFGAFGLRRWGRPAAECVGVGLGVLAALAACSGLLLVQNPLWTPSLDVGGGTTAAFATQAKLLSVAAALWAAGSRVPAPGPWQAHLAVLCDRVHDAGSVVLGLATAVAVRQVFGPGPVSFLQPPGGPSASLQPGELAAATVAAALLAAAFAVAGRWAKRGGPSSAAGGLAMPMVDAGGAARALGAIDPHERFPQVATVFASVAAMLGLLSLAWFNPLWNLDAAAGLGTLALRWLVPALALGLAGECLRRGRRAQAVRPADGFSATANATAARTASPTDAAALAGLLGSIAVAGAFAFAVFALRWWNGGLDPRVFDPSRPGPMLEAGALRVGLKEAACHVAVFLVPGGLAVGAADRGLAGRFAATIRGFGGVSLVLGSLLALVLVAGALNPLWHPTGVSARPVLNGLALAWGVPAGLAATGAWLLGRRRNRPPTWRRPLRLGLAVTAVVFAFGGVSLAVRHGFAHPELSLNAGVSGSAEWWGYSVAWLVLGVALLAGGLWRASAVLRCASLAVLLLAIGKVFLFDVAALGGLFRVASFLGLGLTLMGLGLVYQRYVFADAGGARREA